MARQSSLLKNVDTSYLQALLGGTASATPPAAAPAAPAATPTRQAQASTTGNSLTADQMAIYNDARANNKTLADVIGEQGWNYTPVQVAAEIQKAGLDPINMTRAPTRTAKAEDALARGEIMPLVGWEIDQYNWAANAGLSTAQVAEMWKGQGITQYQIDTVLKAAGLDPLKGHTPPYVVPGAGIPTTVNNQGSDANYPGGLPMQQPGGGGMYGPTEPRENPVNVIGQVPQHPALRMVRQNARRRNAEGWTGTTDTILTGGRGVTGPANLQIKTLLGS